MKGQPQSPIHSANPGLGPQLPGGGNLFPVLPQALDGPPAALGNGITCSILSKWLPLGPLCLGGGQEGLWHQRWPGPGLFFSFPCLAWELRFCFCFQRLVCPPGLLAHTVPIPARAAETCFGLLPLTTLAPGPHRVPLGLPSPSVWGCHTSRAAVCSGPQGTWQPPHPCCVHASHPSPSWRGPPCRGRSWPPSALWAM